MTRLKRTLSLLLALSLLAAAPALAEETAAAAPVEDVAVEQGALSLGEEEVSEPEDALIIVDGAPLEVPDTDDAAPIIDEGAEPSRQEDGAEAAVEVPAEGPDDDGTAQGPLADETTGEAPADGAEVPEPREDEASAPDQADADAGSEPAGADEADDAEEAAANAAPNAAPRIALIGDAIAVGVKERVSLMVAAEDAVQPEECAWASSNPKVAAVAANGVLVAKKAGRAVVTATHGELSATCAVTVLKAPGKVTLRSSLTLGVGQAAALRAALPRGTASYNIAWSSSNRGVVEVSGGALNPVGVGRAKITARTFNGKKSVCTVTVRPAPTALDFGTERVELGEGQALAVSAKLNAGSAGSVSYRVEGPSGVADYANGRLTGRTAGEAVLVAEAHNGVTARLPVSVYPAPTTIQLEETAVLLGVKDSFRLSPRSQTGNLVRCTYASSNKSVAAVSAGGAVVAKRKGTAKITVKSYNGIRAVCTVRVYKRATRFSLSAAERLLERGERFRLTATFPKGTSARVSYRSTDVAVASVDAAGQVTAHALGECRIIARIAGGAERACAVSVLTREARYRVHRVSLSPETASLEKGKALQLSATVYPADAADPALSWSSSDPSVASVDASGRVTALAGGSAVITAWARDGSGASADCAVAVSDPVKYRALLVSESDFYWGAKDGWERITRNKGDVALMAKALKGVKGAEGGAFQVTTRNNTTADELRRLIAATFAEADDNDVSLFFIATHGDSSSTNGNAGALCMASTTARTPDVLRLSALCDCLLAVRGRVVVVLESCGSGAAVYGGDGPSFEMQPNGAARFDELVIEAFRQADPGLIEPALDGVPIEDAIFASPGDLRRVNKFYVLTASAYLEQSWGYETSRGNGNNYFTKWLAAGIGRSGSLTADRKYGGNRNNKADLYELYRYVSAVGDSFAIRSGGKQYYQHVQVYPANYRYEIFR